MRICYLPTLVSVVVAYKDSDFEIRDAPHPQVDVPLSTGDYVSFKGIHYRTSIYENISATNDGQMVEAFLGIPYSEAAVGVNRFREMPLREVDTLESSFDATQWKPGCIQEFGMFTEETSNFSEDCLFLNIWRRKNTNAQDRKPVIVIIHGGGYTAGDSHEFDWRGTQLAFFGDAVVVNFNYRLGIFGFLDLGISGADGHQGHLDQVNVLQWIKFYIKYFGGDPDRVTLFGVSAGSFSISWHLMTGLSKGLYHSAVMDAGVLTLGNAETKAAHIERSRAIVTDYLHERKIKREAFSAEKLRDILTRIPNRKLLELQQKHARSQTYTFRPTYYNLKYFPEPPECLINRKNFKVQVPLIVGDTTNEGLFLLTEKTHDEKPTFNSVKDVIRWDLKILRGHNLESVANYGRNFETLRQFYGLTGENETIPPEQLLEAASQIIGDGLFVCPVMNFANRYSEVQPKTYFFYWNRTRITETFKGEKLNGAYHGLMFYTGAGGEYFYMNGRMAEIDKAFIQAMITMIVEFAKNPNETPRFASRKLAARSPGMVYNWFENEDLQPKLVHPKLAVCNNVWGAFSRSSCDATKYRRIRPQN